MSVSGEHYFLFYEHFTKDTRSSDWWIKKHDHHFQNCNMNILNSWRAPFILHNCSLVLTIIIHIRKRKSHKTLSCKTWFKQSKLPLLALIIINKSDDTFLTKYWKHNYKYIVSKHTNTFIHRKTIWKHNWKHYANLSPSPLYLSLSLSCRIHGKLKCQYMYICTYLYMLWRFEN